jgi:hypothetical protein
MGRLVRMMILGMLAYRTFFKNGRRDEHKAMG